MRVCMALRQCPNVIARLRIEQFEIWIPGEAAYRVLGIIFKLNCKEMKGDYVLGKN